MISAAAACVGFLVYYSRSAIFRHSDIMFKNKKRQFSDGGLLFATLVEFLKCWGSGRWSRLFMESVNGEAFMNFSTFLGNPGKGYSKKNKMASGEETSGYSGSHNDPKSSKKSKCKKSKKKTERDNQRAATFQKKKQEELSAAAATESSPVPEAAASTSTPSKDFQFSELTCVNISSLDSSDNAFMNLDGYVTLCEEGQVVKLSSSKSSDVEISPKDSSSEGDAAAHIIPSRPPDPSWAVEKWRKLGLMDKAKRNGLKGQWLENVRRIVYENSSNFEEAAEGTDETIDMFNVVEKARLHREHQEEIKKKKKSSFKQRRDQR